MVWAEFCTLFKYFSAGNTAMESVLVEYSIPNVVHSVEQG